MLYYLKFKYVVLYQNDQMIGDFLTGYRYVKENDTWKKESTKDGTLMIQGLTWGSYTIKETKASDGYQLQNNTRSFIIGKAGMDMILEVNDIGFTNLQTEVRFKKVATYVESCSDVTLGEGNLPADSTRALSHAEFTAYDAEGNVFDRVSSDENGIVVFHKMVAGQTYTIKETKTPAGFVESTRIYQVTLNEQGQAQGLIDKETQEAVPEVINEIIKTDIVLQKVSEQNPDKAIADSIYGLYRVSKARNMDSKPQLLAVSKTDENGLLRFDGVLMDQEYIIKELVAPQGSHRSEHAITIRYTIKDGKPTIAEFDDGKGTAQLDEQGNIVWYEPDIMVSFTKTDTKGNSLAGASFVLMNEEGMVMDEWVSTTEAHLTTNLLTAGNSYILKETQAPYGYALKEDIEFTVIEKDMGQGQNYIQEITMENTINTLIIEKRDKDSRKLIMNAHLVVLNEDHTIARNASGEAISWVSQGDDRIEGLGKGRYLLHEIQAPEDYQLAEDIAFTIDANGVLHVDGTIQDRLVMLDEVKPKDELANGGKVDSGDQSEVQMYLLLFGLSVLSLGVLLRKLFEFRKGSYK